jgi:hypothetical protein
MRVRAHGILVIASLLSLNGWGGTGTSSVSVPAWRLWGERRQIRRLQLFFLEVVVVTVVSLPGHP